MTPVIVALTPAGLGTARRAQAAIGGEVHVLEKPGATSFSVALTAKRPVSILVPIANGDKMIARIVYEGPVVAPVEAGMPVGSLKIWIGETLSQETPLFTAENVAVGKLHQRAIAQP